MSRLKLLLVAPCADRNDVGEAWSSHQWCSRLAQRHDVTVLTYHKHGHTPLSQQLPLARVIEWPDLPAVHRFERFNSLFKPGNPVFRRRAARALRALLQRGEGFDLAHHLAPLALRYPTPLLAADLPYILGPLAGSLPTPTAFRREFTEPWYVRLRALDSWRLRHDPALKATFRRARAVIGVAPYVHDLLSHLDVRRTALLSETGVERMPPPADDRPDPRDGLRLLFVGRLVRSKGLNDALRALADIERDRAWTLDVLGDGEQRRACESLVDQHDLRERVTFHGRVPRAQVDRFYDQAHVFLFPSFREPSGNVVIEAMSRGLAMIVADRGGPAHAVTTDAGFRIPPTNPEVFATGIADAVRAYLDDPLRAAQHGAAARQRCADEFLWDNKIERLEQLYRDVLADNTQPDVAPTTSELDASVPSAVAHPTQSPPQSTETAAP